MQLEGVFVGENSCQSTIDGDSGSEGFKGVDFGKDSIQPFPTILSLDPEHRGKEKEENGKKLFPGSGDQTGTRSVGLNPTLF